MTTQLAFQTTSIREHIHHLISTIIPYDEADFLASNPVFVTLTLIEGLTPSHTDASLWYVLKGDSHAAYKFDKEEFNDIRWFHFDDIPYTKSDPHMLRFVEKLKGSL